MCYVPVKCLRSCISACHYTIHRTLFPWYQVFAGFKHCTGKRKKTCKLYSRKKSFHIRLMILIYTHLAVSHRQLCNILMIIKRMVEHYIHTWDILCIPEYASVISIEKPLSRKPVEVKRQHINAAACPSCILNKRPKLPEA